MHGPRNTESIKSTKSIKIQSTTPSSAAMTTERRLSGLKSVLSDLENLARKVARKDTRDMEAERRMWKRAQEKPHERAQRREYNDLEAERKMFYRMKEKRTQDKRGAGIGARNREFKLRRN